MTADKFATAGVRGALHARPVDDCEAAEVAFRADEPIPMASLYKLVVLVAFSRAVDAGELDPVEPITIEPGDRTFGETGISAMEDNVTMSWRDIARSMIVVSDNAAGDRLVGRLGLESVAAAISHVGLSATQVRGGTEHAHRLLTDDLDAADLSAAFAVLSDNGHIVQTRALDPLLASSTTPRDMTTLLAAIWRDTAASIEQCAFMRRVLGAQVWPHRLSSGFPYPNVRVSGKTGTFGPLRHEVGVVEHRDEPAIAVAVLTESARADRNQPRVDRCIGEVAASAVGDIRARVAP